MVKSEYQCRAAVHLVQLKRNTLPSFQKHSHREVPVHPDKCPRCVCFVFGGLLARSQHHQIETKMMPRCQSLRVLLERLQHTNATETSVNIHTHVCMRFARPLDQTRRQSQESPDASTKHANSFQHLFKSGTDVGCLLEQPRITCQSGQT